MSVACLILVVLLALCPSPAWAVPAPMSPADLLAASDLVALIRVLSVTCLEVWRHGGTGEELASFEARLGVLRVTKGQARRYRTVRLTWEEVSSQTLGNWCVRYSTKRAWRYGWATAPAHTRLAFRADLDAQETKSRIRQCRWVCRAVVTRLPTDFAEDRVPRAAHLLEQETTEGTKVVAES